MPARSVLLRLLLSLVLILNGSGYASAAVAMPMRHMAMTASAPMPPAPASHSEAGKADLVADRAVAAPPCHPAGADAKALPASPPESAPANHPSQSGQAGDECCTSAACRCACVFNASATAPIRALPGLPVAQAAGCCTANSGHASPALPHLIRPPIG